MLSWCKIAFVTLVTLLACDGVWLTVMSARLYRPHLHELMRDDVMMVPAVAFYLLYLGGVLVFAVAPARNRGDWRNAAWRGGFLGLVAYATYDLTNQATLRNWPVVITLADLAWGTVLTALAATAGYGAARRWPV
ncbi:MAG: DUF2177 family protein [Sphingomonadales bacterium]|nr:DUF2177 family protein [Sphingomonadales bacterium]MDE2168148.1 DUF2177 family protein [Sphingomonadales bacterium]